MILRAQANGMPLDPVFFDGKSWSAPSFDPSASIHNQEWQVNLREKLVQVYDVSSLSSATKYRLSILFARSSGFGPPEPASKEHDYIVQEKSYAREKREFLQKRSGADTVQKSVWDDNAIPSYKLNSK
eukprot:9475356-Pyramimonas_sp.AAC.2